MTDSERINQEDEQMEALNTSLSERVKDTGFWKEFLYQVRLIWYLIRDPEVPIYVKIIPLVALIYVLIPTDLIPDVFPVMGQLDDITALLVGGKVFIEMSPPHVVRKYLAMLRHRNGGDAARESMEDLTDEETANQIEDAIVIEGDFVEVDTNMGSEVSALESTEEE